MTITETLKLALDALEQIKQETFHPAKVFAHNHAITAIREALTSVPDWASEAIEQPSQQEPVAWLDEYGNAFPLAAKQYSVVGKHWKPLYTSPPPHRKPLTHEQRFDLLTKFEPHKNKWEAPAILIDMVEAAHGIKGNT